MLKKWGALILVILLAAASAGSAELIQITLADGGSECGSERERELKHGLHVKGHQREGL